MEANYDNYSIIEILSRLGKDKAEQIIKKCPSPNPNHIASAINSTIICLNELCDSAEKLLSEEIIHALLAQKYLEYDRMIKDDNIKCSIRKEFVELLPDNFKIAKIDDDEGFYIGNYFIGIV